MGTAGLDLEFRGTAGMALEETKVAERKILERNCVSTVPEMSMRSVRSASSVEPLGR